MEYILWAYVSKIIVVSSIYFLPIADIDECKVNNGGCHQVCMNVPGSFVCACNKGYFLTSDKIKCEGKCTVGWASLFALLLL